MSSLVQHVQETLRSQGLLPRAARVLVAVSGGMDSTALLRVLNELAGANGWRLVVAHFNHRLRGRSSDADERLVRQMAGQLRLPVVVGRADVRPYGRKHKLSIEMAARKLRHDFLARAAMQKRCPFIALAHQADDQLELFFLRLLRGSGTEGLAGMKWTGPSPANPKLSLVRPLLDVPKSGLAAFAREQGIRFREDATNASLDVARNRIRHELLPLIRKRYQPALDKVIPRLMTILEAEGALVTELARKWLAKPGRVRFGALPVAVQRRCLQMKLLAKGLTPDFATIEALRLRPAAAIGGAKASGPDGRAPVRAWRAQVLSVPLSANPRLRGKVEFGDRRFCWRIERRAGAWQPPRSEPQTERFDADAVGSLIMLRHWRPGDRFQPSGMKNPVKLQDLFTNEKIPQAERHRLVVAATASGEVFWVEKLRISERFKLRKGTNRTLLWEWKSL